VVEAWAEAGVWVAVVGGERFGRDDRAMEDDQPTDRNAADAVETRPTSRKRGPRGTLSADCTGEGWSWKAT
jgi:hypothetical protein